MKSKLTQLLAVSFVVASAIAVPTAVKAQADTLTEIDTVAAAEEGEITSELNYCIVVPGWGEFCF